jgi:serine/threonine-protein kinase
MNISDWFKILKPISSAGGMCGGVYLGEDKKSRQQVAIKHLIPQSQRAVELFRREANNYVYLRHPNLMQVIEFVEDTQKGYFLIMELIKGMSLQEV